MNNLVKAIECDDWDGFKHAILEIKNIDDAIDQDLPPLALAAKYGRAAMVIHLIANCGAEVDSTYSAGRLAVRMASQYDQLAIMKILIANGANIDFARNNSSSALRTAARLNHTEMVEYLLSQRAYPDSVASSSKLAASHWAVKNNNPRMLYALLEAGASLEMTTRSGKSVLDLLQERKTPEMLEYYTQKSHEQEHKSKQALIIQYKRSKESAKETLKENAKETAGVILMSNQQEKANTPEIKLQNFSFQTRNRTS